MPFTDWSMSIGISSLPIRAKCTKFLSRIAMSQAIGRRIAALFRLAAAKS
tara:strand:- start:265 stop:414 length:150 start_codon:yes stop_codon:yes gene_type:complete